MLLSCTDVEDRREFQFHVGGRGVPLLVLKLTQSPFLHLFQVEREKNKVGNITLLTIMVKSSKPKQIASKGKRSPASFFLRTSCRNRYRKIYNREMPFVSTIFFPGQFHYQQILTQQRRRPSYMCAWLFHPLEHHLVLTQHAKAEPI